MTPKPIEILNIGLALTLSTLIMCSLIYAIVTPEILGM